MWRMYDPAVIARPNNEIFDLAGLNDAQRRAVEAIDGPVLVLAGAGTGKTRVLTTRLAYILATGQALPAELLAVTFTNKAADQMKVRVRSLLLGPRLGDPVISTFHSFCVRLLRREIEVLGYRRDFTIYDSSDQLAVVKQALKALHIYDSYVQPRAALSRISHLKNRMEGP